MLEQYRTKPIEIMSEEQGLKIPFAYDGDHFVHPSEAERTDTYFCPNCNEELIYRKGEHKRPHFAHHGGTVCSAPETILHHAAKRRLRQLVEEGIEIRSKTPFFVRECGLCCKPKVKQHIPDYVRAVALEKRLPNGYQPDVLLLSDEEEAQPIAALEVVVTNAVEEQKANSIDLPWMEIQGEDVMATLGEESPVHIKVNRDSLESASCKGCQEQLSKVWGRIRDLLDEYNMEWPETRYQVGLASCWKCKSAILVFRWGNSKYSKRLPPDPQPRTVQFRYSEVRGAKYWVNTCPRCKSVQEDRFPGEIDTLFGGNYINYDPNSMLLKRAQEVGLLP